MKANELTEFCDGSCPQPYCFIRSLVELDQKYNKRLIMQMKMIEVYKYKLETESKKEVGWQESLRLWIENGMAQKYAEVFDDKVSVKEMKRRLFGTT